MSITQERLKQLLHYDPGTGMFTWKVKVSSNVNVGDIAGYKHCKGYICLSVDKNKILAHRAAWLYMTGDLPKNQVDHINMQKTDNRWCNLRDVNNSINHQNKCNSLKNSAVPYLGVANHHTGKFRATIKLNGKNKHIGLYETPEEAHQAYLEVKREIHEGCTI